MSSSVAFQTPDTVLEVAAGSSAVAAVLRNYPSAAQVQYSSSPCHLMVPELGQRRCSDTCSISAAHHSDSRCTRSPCAPRAFDRNTSPRSQACCAGPAMCRACSLSLRMSWPTSVSACQCSRTTPGFAAPSVSLLAAGAVAGQLEWRTS